MRLEGESTLLRIFIGESDRWHGRPLYAAIVVHVVAYRGGDSSKHSPLD
jgi:PII-like signaling protein